MRAGLLAFLALLLVACSDVRSFEETSEQFQRDRVELEQLALAALACEEASNFIARDTERTGCVGDISRDLHRLGYRRASVSDGRWRVYIVNGDDGAPIGSVSSGMFYRRIARTIDDGERPLTPAPHHWFYFQHD